MTVDQSRLQGQLPDWIMTGVDRDVDIARQGSVSIRRPDGRMFVLGASVLALLRAIKAAPSGEVDRVLADHGLDPDEATYQRLEGLTVRLNDQRARLEAPGFLARREVVSPRAAARAGRLLTPLFDRRVVVAGLLLLIALDVVTVGGLDLGSIGLGAAWVTLPALLLAAGFHELGHSAALVRARGRPGGIGVGVYLIWPVFYADTTDAWSLTRRQRMLVDAAGVYFQLWAANVVLGVGLASGAVEWQVAGLLVQLATLVNFNPLFRYDGHWLLADWLGVTDLYRAGRRAWSSSGRDQLRPRDRLVLRTFWLLTVLFWPVVLGGAVLVFGWQTAHLVGTGQIGGASLTWPPSPAAAHYALTALVLALSAYRVAVIALRWRRDRRAGAPVEVGRPEGERRRVA